MEGGLIGGRIGIGAAGGMSIGRIISLLEIVSLICGLLLDVLDLPCETLHRIFS